MGTGSRGALLALARVSHKTGPTYKRATCIMMKFYRPDLIGIGSRKEDIKQGPLAAGDGNNHYLTLETNLITSRVRVPA